MGPNPPPYPQSVRAFVCVSAYKWHQFMHAAIISIGAGNISSEKNVFYFLNFPYSLCTVL